MCVYKQFCNETFDENGRLKKITLDYPDNFNFGYDVVDKIADEVKRHDVAVFRAHRLFARRINVDIHVVKRL